MLIVCDIDGTISDCRHREHLAGAGDWDAFHSFSPQDKPFHKVAWLLAAVTSFGADLCFLTGRPEQYRPATVEWLLQECGLSEHDDYQLWMRPKDDWRSDVELKTSILREEILPAYGVDSDNVILLEDRDKLVAAMRDNGFSCFQTAQGAY